MAKKTPIEIIGKHCGMCEFSAPAPDSKVIFCTRFPPQMVLQLQTNTITKELIALAVPMFAQCPDGIVCGEFKYGSSAQRDTCQLINQPPR